MLHFYIVIVIINVCSTYFAFNPGCFGIFLQNCYLGSCQASKIFFFFFPLDVSQAYRRELLEAYECCINYKRTGKDAELTQV